MLFDRVIRRPKQRRLIRFNAFRNTGSSTLKAACCSMLTAVGRINASLEIDVPAEPSR
jgi:hypothetical protein